jgi:thiol-disulfide isomerase/thioredoxin
MDRATFLTSALASLAATASPKPSPSPSLARQDTCLKSAALPYDRPLDMTMPVLDGPDFQLKSYRGRAVLLNIFTTWCGPCNEEQYGLVLAAARYASLGLSVIGIDDRELDETVRAYRRRFRIAYPIAMDRRGDFTRALMVGGGKGRIVYPTSIFITPQGYLYCYMQDYMEPAELNSRIKKFLADAPPVIAPSPSPSPSPSA